MRASFTAALASAGLALAGCASMGEPAPPAPTRFQDVRSLVLVRAGGERGARPKDALDGLEETLRARGFSTRTVELGRDAAPEHAALERLFRDLDIRASAARAERIATPIRQVAGAAEVVAQLGVDAIATYHRLERSRAPSPPPTLRGTGAPPPPVALPLGALLLVDRGGNVATFAWGDAGSFEDPGLPLNAAEAIELLVRALTGEQGP